MKLMVTKKRETFKCDPTRVIAKLEKPLIIPWESEREGYVPNVVYSCGGMLHGETLVIPYCVSDTSSKVAMVELAPLFKRLLSSKTSYPCVR